MLAIGLLIVLSIAGAFYGTEKAKLLFNSIPLEIYWFSFAILLAAGFIGFPRLVRKPGLFMVHAGCLLILAGGFWGSQTGHLIGERVLGIRKIPSSYMLIREGETENSVMSEDFGQQIGKLPFSIELKDFRLEYYQTDEDSAPQLHIQTQDMQHFKLAAREGEEISLGQGKGKLAIVRTFRNFKIRVEDDKRIVTDEEAGEENPALEVRIETPDGNSHTRYVFGRFEDFDHGADNELKLNYVSQRPAMIRDYFSDIAVIENGKEAASKTIEVNRPLHYKGYHLYQHSYDSLRGEYTILSVVSDSGLNTVYAGYWLLSLGVLWQFWLKSIAGYIKQKKIAN